MLQVLLPVSKKKIKINQRPDGRLMGIMGETYRPDKSLQIASNFFMIKSISEFENASNSLGEYKSWAKNIQAFLKIIKYNPPSHRP